MQTVCGEATVEHEVSDTDDSMVSGTSHEAERYREMQARVLIAWEMYGAEYGIPFDSILDDDGKISLNTQFGRGVLVGK